MSELPQGWASANLLTVATMVRGVTYTKDVVQSQSFNNSVPVLRANNIQKRGFDLSELVHVPNELVSAGQKIRKGDVVIASSSGSISVVGKAAQADRDMYSGFGAFCTLLRPDSILNANFFGYFFSTDHYRSTVSNLARGSNINNLKREHFASLEIPIAPAAEQTRIANQLDTLLTRVQACNDRFDAIPALLKRFRQTVLDAATTGQLTDDWRIDKLGQITAEEVVAARLAVAGARPTKAASEFFASHQPVTPQKGILPGTWLLTHIGMVGVVSNGSTPSRQEPSYWGSGIPWVSSGEVANGVIRRTREQITSDGFSNSSVRLLPRGSVLMAMIGEGKTRGQSAILDIDACINQNIAGVVPVGGILDSKYLWFWFRREYENTRTKGNGSGPKALNCERVRELEINLPPLPEQAEIVRRVEALFTLADRIEARCTAARTQAQRLTPLVLAKAFRGELVPQDPNDEPASALLARIVSSNTVVAGKNKRKVPVARKERA